MLLGMTSYASFKMGDIKLLELSTLFAIFVFTQSACVNDSSAVEVGVRLLRHVFMVKEKVSMYTCIAECQMSGSCQSVNYKPRSRRCEMNKLNDVDSVDWLPSDEYTYIDMAEWPVSLTGPCSDVNCLASQRCSVSRGTHTRCIDEFPGCGAPVALFNSTVQYTGSYLGSTAVYTCVDGYHMCGEANVAYCSDDRTWTGVNVTCKIDAIILSDFIDSEKQPLPCPMKEGASVSISGTPENLTRQGKISVNLMRDTDIVIHYDIRFFSQVVIWNTYIGGVWGTLQELTSFPFDYGQHFHLNITRSAGLYQAVVDGAFHSNFPDGHPGVDPDAIEVNFDVRDPSVTMDGCPWC